MITKKMKKKEFDELKHKFLTNGGYLLINEAEERGAVNMADAITQYHTRIGDRVVVGLLTLLGLFAVTLLYIA